MCLFTFKQIVPQLLEQDDVISYEVALRMFLAQGAGMVCAGPGPTPSHGILPKLVVRSTSYNFHVCNVRTLQTVARSH